MTTNGITVRVRLLVGCVLMALVTLGTAACGGSGSGSGSAATNSGPGSGSGTSETATNPRTESSGAESPGRTANGTSVSLPSLPIGGSPPSPALRQCVDVSWTGLGLVEGAAVTVTHAGFKGPGFVLAGGGCGGSNCVGFSFRPGHTSCTLAVRATASQGLHATVDMAGTAQCVEEKRQWCADLKTQDNFSAIEVTQPSPADSEPSSPTSPSDSTSTSTSTTTSPSTTNS